MARHLSGEWKSLRIEEINRFKTDINPEPINLKLADNVAVRWLICEWMSKGIEYKLVNLGAGLKLLTTETDICPKCGGTGRC